MGINGDGSERMSSWQRGFSLGALLLFLVVGVAGVSLAATGAEPELRRELELLKARMEQDRKQMEQDRQRIERLEPQFQSVATRQPAKSPTCCFVPDVMGRAGKETGPLAPYWRPSPGTSPTTPACKRSTTRSW